MGESELPGALRRFDLSGRVALVTGASSGLGAEVARGLASVGARVAVVARRQDRLTALAGEIGGLAVGADLLDLARLGELVPRVAAELGGPEILVNVGQRFSAEQAESEPLEAIRQTLDLNLIAPFRLAQEVFPHMRRPAAARSSTCPRSAGTSACPASRRPPTPPASSGCPG